MLLPMGGHRGYALNVMWEVFTGILSGGKSLTELHSPGELDQPTGNSLFLLAIDPSALMPYDKFIDRVDTLIDNLHASPTASGFDGVRVPGENGAENESRNRRTGIPIPLTDVAKLQPLASELGVSWPESLRNC
jgi:LDH2 family malate/lactate/ureidoglycolate dehydrogenase